MPAVKAAPVGRPKRAQKTRFFVHDDPTRTRIPVFCACLGRNVWLITITQNAEPRILRCAIATLVIVVAMDRIVIDPAVCNGRPIIKGTRIAVQSIFEALGAGDSIDDVLAAYPAVQYADILAAFQYSARLLAKYSP